MLMFLFNDIPNTCQLLLGLLFLIITHWTIRTVKECRVPGSRKKWKKYLEPCLTSLKGSREKGTDPERSSEDLNLEYTLRTLDRNIQYLAWQMQRITGPTACPSASVTSVETVISHCSWTHSSAGSRSRTPPSLMPAILGRDVQSGQLQQHLIRPPGAGLQQVRVEALSQRKVDFNIRQKQLKEQWGGPTPHSESLTKLIPSAPPLHPATKRTNPSMQIRAGRILSYKEQELLNWHVQKKHQQKETAPLHLVATRALIGNDDTQVSDGALAGGTVLWVSQQPPVAQRSRSPTLLQSNAQVRRTPPKSPRAQSPGPCAQPPVPPPGEQPPLPMLICKTESHSKVSGSVQVKVSGGTHKEELAEMLSMLGQSKSPALREPGRPRTPKEKEKDSHSPARRPGSPKEDLGRVGRVGSLKDKPVEVKVSLKTDQTMHTLSWTNLPEILRPSPTQEQAPAAQPKFLDPAFMCQNQLELPCIVTAREQQNQKSYTFAEPHTCLPVGTPKPQCLAHTIVQSVDTEQAMRDLQMQLAKGLETGNSQPSVEYPLCLMCGRCTPYCPHPRTRHSPCLLVYPRLDVRDGEVYMTLGFLLKIKRSEADEWGLTQGRDVLQTPHGKEHPSKKEKSRHTTPHRKGHPRPQEPKTLNKTPRVAREFSPEHGDQDTRGPGTTPQAPRVLATTPGPAAPQTSKTQFQPPPARPPPRTARPPPQTARPPPQTARPPPQTARPPTPTAPTARRPPPTAPTARPPPPTARQGPPEKPSSVLKQLLSTIKRIWARVRQEAEKCPEKCSEKFSPKKSSPSKKSGTPLPAPASSEPRKESGALALPSPTPGDRVKGAISNTRLASPLSTGKREASPFKSATPQTPSKVGTPIINQATSSKLIPPKDRRGLSPRFKEPDSPRASKKKPGILKKSPSPKMPRKSPSLPRRTPSRQSTP